jgi:hypothetical protein
LLQSSLEDPVFFAEGEKACDALRAQGFVAVTTAGGASRNQFGDVLEPLRHRAVVVFPDNDPAGRVFGLRAATALKGIAAYVNWVEPPGLGPSGDAWDYFGAGGSREELRARIVPVPNLKSFEPSVLLTRITDMNFSEAQSWIVDGIVPEGLSAVIGSPGSGKSFLTLDVAMSVATGMDWHGHPVHRGGVIYVCAEGESGIARRLRAWQSHHKVSATDFWMCKVVQLVEPEELNALIRAIEVVVPNPQLVVIDTLARSMVGLEENSQRDMGLVIAAADRIRHETGASVVFAHHTSKAGGQRGSSALHGALDMMSELTRNRQTLKLACKKMKDGPDFETKVLTLVPCDESLAVQAAGLVSGGSLGPAASASDLTRSIETQLASLAAFGTQGAELKTWKISCSVSPTTFYRNLPKMLASGLVELNGSAYVATASFR